MPGMDVVSMKDIATHPMTDGPVADARHGRALSGLLEEALAPEHVANHVTLDRDRVFAACRRDVGRGLSQELADLAAEAAYAHLAGVFGDHLARLVGDLDLLVAQPVLLQLPGPQIPRAISTFSSVV